MASEKIVLADWLFTLPAIVVQAVTGLSFARMLGIRCRVAGWPGHLRCSAWRGFAGFQIGSPRPKTFLKSSASSRLCPASVKQLADTAVLGPTNAACRIGEFSAT